MYINFTALPKKTVKKMRGKEYILRDSINKKPSNTSMVAEMIPVVVFRVRIGY